MRLSVTRSDFCLRPPILSQSSKGVNGSLVKHSQFPFGTTMGFDVGRFLEPVDDDLKCGICYGVLEEPLATPCGHVYCARCILQWTAESGYCPLTCEQINVDDLKKILPLSTLIAKQNIRCENFRRGCSVILKVENIPSHLLKCQYAKDNTSGGRIMERKTNSSETREFARVIVCENGCGLPLLSQNSVTHDCVKALQTQIASLQLKLTRAEQEKELACERIAKREETFQDRILNLENELHSYQIQVLNFERQFKDYRAQVGVIKKQAETRVGQTAEYIEVEVSLSRVDGSLGFNIMGGSEVGNNLSGGGIVVSKVADSGPASKEDGLKVQDIIFKVNGTDLSEASHFTAVEVIKSASEPLQILVKRKLVDESLDDCVPQLVSTGTQTDLSFAQEVESMDTDSGIHDRYSPRQDLLNPFEKSLDDGTSSSECSRRRLESFCREDVENLRSTSESLPSSENIVYSEQGTLPRVTRLLKDVNYVNHLDENSNCKLEEQPYVTAISDEIYFDPEFDYEYEEITLWIANSELGLTFCCGEEDESTVHVCEIDPGSVAYFDGRMTLWDGVLKINDVPVTHISDIEPLVYESMSTIKFLVARPAQEVQATLLGIEGSHDWSFIDPIDADLSNVSIGVIKEEDEDVSANLDDYHGNGDKCEKDSGVGRTNDESSEQDLGEVVEEVVTLNNTEKGSQENGEKRQTKEDLSACESKSSSSSSRSNEEKSFSPKRSRDSNDSTARDKSTAVDKDSSRNKKDKSSESSGSKRRNGSPSKNCLSPTRNGGSPPRKDKERNKDRKKTRVSHRDNCGVESRGERDRERDRDRDRDRDRSRNSDQKRNNKLGNVSRTIRASYIKAVNKDSTQHINWIGEWDCFGGKLDHRSQKKSNLNDNESLNGSQQNIEWKVRMSKDGSQIFVRKRPVTAARQARNKLLRERAQKISEERKGMTTDDDTHTVYQGRYWPREDRRRHLERVREARRKKMQKLQQIKESESPHTCSGSESGKGRRDIIVEMSHKRMNKNKQQFDDFTTVREYLTQRNPDGSPVGPIHVTTV